MKDQPTIIIDHREHANELKDCLQEHYTFIVSVEHLTLGDYSFGVNTIVERKTTHDFCLSIIDGRLFKQAWRLANHRVHNLRQLQRCIANILKRGQTSLRPIHFREQPLRWQIMIWRI